MLCDGLNLETVQFFLIVDPVVEYLVGEGVRTKLANGAVKHSRRIASGESITYVLLPPFLHRANRLPDVGLPAWRGVFVYVPQLFGLR